MRGIIHIAPSSSRWIRSSAVNERNLCTSSTDHETAIFWLLKKGALVQNSCVLSKKVAFNRSLCWFKSSLSRVASSMTQAVTILSGQSVISRVYTSHFGNGTARLEPQPRWYWKKNQVLYPVENPPKVSRTIPCCTMQWKNAITQLERRLTTLFFCYQQFFILFFSHNITSKI